MDSRFRAVADEYANRAAQEFSEMQTLPPAQIRARLDDMLLAVGEETAALMSLLIKGARSQTILEVGTSYGYSTLHLAEAARSVGGRVTTVELSSKKAEHAKEAIARAGLAEYVQFLVGDALTVLETLPAPIDFVLIDLWKDLYVPCLEILAPKLSGGAIVVADNMIHPEGARPAAAAYQRRVRELGLDSVLLTVGSGLEISRKPT